MVENSPPNYRQSIDFTAIMLAGAGLSGPVTMLRYLSLINHCYPGRICNRTLKLAVKEYKLMENMLKNAPRREYPE